MKKILAVTSGEKTPSSRFRIRQHIEALNESGLEVIESCPPIEKNCSVPFLQKYSPRYYLPIYFLWVLIKALQRLPLVVKKNSYDYIWLNRELVTGYYTLEGLLGKKVVLDVDDAIWKNPPFGHYAAKKIAQQSAAIICGNDYLADWFRQYNDNVYIIPTAVDTRRFAPDNRMKNPQTITLGWIGTHGNLKYLSAILPILTGLVNQFEYLRVTIVCDKSPQFITAHPAFEFIKWSEGQEVVNFQKIDIGLMPLDDDEWSKGKCSFKLLQHLSCGSLVVGSPVGMNKKVLLGQENGAWAASTPEEWQRTLSYLIENFGTAYACQSDLARRFIVDHFSSEKIQSELKKVFLHG